MVWFGNGLEPLWPLLWFAPLPVLLFALRSSWKSAALVAALAWLAGCLNLWHYFRVQEVPFAVWLAVFSIAALVFALAVLLFRALALRDARWSALLAFPATWVCYEYARNLATPHATAGSIAYSQLIFLPFLQLASITGPWGMSFLLTPVSRSARDRLAFPCAANRWRRFGSGGDSADLWWNSSCHAADVPEDHRGTHRD